MLGPNDVNASWPPDTMTRRHSRAAASMSGTKKMPEAQMTASNDPSGRSSACTSPTRTSIGRPSGSSVPRAISSMPSEMSMPSTDPDGPTRSAAARAAWPVPVATSRTRAPGWRSATSMRRSAACRTKRSTS